MAVTVRIVVNSGLFKHAGNSASGYDIEQARERIGSVLASAIAEKYTNPEYNENEFLNNYITNELPDISIIEDIIILDNWAFELDRSVPKLGRTLGTADKLPPVVKEITVTSKSSNSINVEVKVDRLKNGKLSYYYKKNGEIEYKVLKENKEEIIANYIGLEQNVVYNIKVVVNNENGSGEKEINVVTGTLPQGVIKQKGETEWNSTAGTASIELESTQELPEGVKIQYQINDETDWHDYTGAITDLQNEDFVAVRLYDGTNENSGESSITILDIEKPNLAEINLSGTSASEVTSVTATVTHSDNKSGIDIANCKWAYVNSSEWLGTEDSDLSKYTGTFGNNGEEITLSSATQGEYYLHVLSVDRAGNRTETVSNKITVKQLATGITLNIENATIRVGETLNLTATVLPSTIENKQVTWTSNDENVAIVNDSGEVTAKAVGNAIITAKTTDGSNKTATCGVTVSNLTTDRSILQVGDYINYTPDTADTAYSLTRAVSGYTSDQSIPKDKTLKWQVMNINEDGSVDLVSTESIDTTVYFKNAIGYNNAVYVLNDLCNKQYSNDSLGTKARSIKIEDIENKFNSSGQTAKADALKKTPTNLKNNYNIPNYYMSSIDLINNRITYNTNYFYPDIYQYENGAALNSTTVKTDGIGRSDVYSGYTNGITTNTSKKARYFIITNTFYYFDDISSSYFDDSSFYNLIFDTDNGYYLASRNVGCYKDRVLFQLFFVSGANKIGGASLFKSDGTITSIGYPVRPVVHLGANVKISKPGGTADSPRDIDL